VSQVVTESKTDMNETTRPRRTLRSIGAVLAGFLAIVIVTTITDAVMHGTGIFPPAGEAMSTPLWLLATAYRIVYGVAGGYITARLAPGQSMRHALVLGVIGLILSIVGAVVTWNLGPGFGPHWYPLALVVIAIPSAWLGGKLYGNR
jgi:surface polysaccharide O-acyltransferase-like enzyme